MESVRPRPPGVLDPEAIPDLAATFDDPGPFVSVYLTTEPAVENASRRSEARWAALRRELAGAGAPDDLVAVVDRVALRRAAVASTTPLSRDDPSLLDARFLDLSASRMDRG